MPNSFPNYNGSSDIKEIYLATGYCASKWEHLMARVFALYAAVSTGNPFSALPAFSAIPNSRSQLDAAERQCQYRLGYRPTGDSAHQNDGSDASRELRKSSTTIFERVRRHAKKRNQVIHGHITEMNKTITDNEGVTSSYRGFYVVKSIYTNITLGSYSAKQFFYTGEHIVEFANVLEACRQDFNKFGDDVLSYLGQRDGEDFQIW